MYSLYTKTTVSEIYRYEFVEAISLFGCNEGYIPWLLADIIPPEQSEPYKWHIRIEDGLRNQKMEDRSLIIDLKPNNIERTLSLYEVADVWGNSDAGWTPIMMRLRGLFVEQEPEGIDERCFERSLEEIDDPIFSMLYLNGSVMDGQLVGRWTPPRASPTNSALLWPDTFAFFAKEAGNIIKADCGIHEINRIIT
jgi:hypothetical protein